MAVLDYNGNRSFVGCVLKEREYNGYHDSDFFALVYDEARDSVYEVEFATTRGGCGAAFGTYLDATDEVLDKAEAVFKRYAYESFKRADEDAAKTADKGKTVKLTRTVRSRKARTFEAGETGEVFWRGEDRFKVSYSGFKFYRVGVLFADGVKHFFSEDDVEVLDYTEYLTSDAELREKGDARGAYKRRYLAETYAAKYEAGRKRNAEYAEAEKLTAGIGAMFRLAGEKTEAVAA